MKKETRLTRIIKDLGIQDTFQQHIMNYEYIESSHFFCSTPKKKKKRIYEKREFLFPMISACCLSVAADFSRYCNNP